MTTDDPKGLRECPFCGGAGKLHSAEDGDGRFRFYVMCQGDDCAGSISWDCETADEAYETWNTRHNDKQVYLKNLEIISLSEQLSAAMKQLGERAKRIGESEEELSHQRMENLAGSSEAERRGAERMMVAIDLLYSILDGDPDGKRSELWAEWDRRRGEG